MRGTSTNAAGGGRRECEEWQSPASASEQVSEAGAASDNSAPSGANLSAQFESTEFEPGEIFCMDL